MAVHARLFMYMTRLPVSAVVLASFLASSAACTPAAPAAEPTPSLTVATVAPRSQTISREVRASGAMAAWEEIQIGAELPGVRVEAVLVEVGDTVRKGEIVVRLDARTASAQLARSDAAVREAEAALVLAASRAKRTRALAAEALLPAQDVDDVVAGEARAHAQLDTAEANRDVAQLQVDFATIRAPQAGLISARTVQPGQMVGTGELLRLIRGGRLEWRAELDEADLMRVATGAAVVLDSLDGASVAGRVRQIAPGIDAGRRTGTVYVDVPQPGPLRPGAFAQGRIVLGEQTALTVPAEAVVRRDGRAYVFLIDTDKRARQRLVDLGVDVGQDVEIRGGLAAGDAVVARGAGFLSDGDFVRITSDAPAASAAPLGSSK
jgi:RND family efflux transporter MFP subunit